MLYNAYELQKTWLNSASTMASIGAELLSNPSLPMGYSAFASPVASALEVFAHATATYDKPAFGIETVEVDSTAFAVEEATVVHRAFGDLKRFVRDGLPDDAPTLLIVAPMSGHYATLLRGTVERMVETARVYITDWADAKMVPTGEGEFDLDDYIDYLIGFLAHIEEAEGRRAHMMAVCQPSVPALAATALMNRDDHPQHGARPCSLTMMGGPIDTRESPTTVNDLAMQRPIEWFANTVIATVPLQYRGAGRRVYPGFLQLFSFMSMNLDGHIQSHYELFKHLNAGDDDAAAVESAQATKDFYDEYRSVCDMTAEFYLQTVEEVFQRHSIPEGTFEHRGRIVDLGDIADTAILCVEGERDDISGIGQTKAALKLATGLDDAKKAYLLAEGAGHYGIFNGSRWRKQVAPRVDAFMAEHGG
ncbi:MAG: polyhydroxyalkanoate depolymerase [Parerythrobacter sp.]